MDINAVSGSAVTTTQAVLTPANPEVASATVAPKAETSQPKHDSVELSGAALAKSLKLAGQTPAQIALKMGLDIKIVDSYLAIKTPTTTVAPPANPVPQVQQTATTPAATTSQPSNSVEEAKEPASEKIAETA